MATWRVPYLSGVPSSVQQAFTALAKFLTTMAPAGTIVAYGGTVVPDGHLLCNGNAVSRTTYRDLFAAIGTTWGVGDGSTTFNVPNLSGRFLQGAASPGGLGGTTVHNHGGILAYAGGGGNGANITDVDHRPPWANVVFLVKT